MREVLENNPYQLIEDINGIGFKTADGIAEKMGISGESEYRIRAGILYALQESFTPCSLPPNPGTCICRTVNWSASARDF